MRLVFACENGAPERLVTAGKITHHAYIVNNIISTYSHMFILAPDELMTIMDIIIGFKLETGLPNQLLFAIGDKACALLWDMFVWFLGI